MTSSATKTIKEKTTDTSTGDGNRWKVIAHDDDKTSMEFVVRIFVQVFNKPVIFAEAMMWQVHNQGVSIVDVLPEKEARQKAKLAMVKARMEGFPFTLTVEPDS